MSERVRADSFFGRGIVAHVAFADPICEELRQLLLSSARALNARAHDGGTYVNMEGPAFSTRAESITNHKLGYDVIGMTNLGEAKCAREAEIAYATMAMITDYDCWNEEHDHVKAELAVGVGLGAGRKRRAFHVAIRAAEVDGWFGGLRIED